MLDIKKQENERALLVAVRTKDTSREVVEEYIDELELLAETAGAEVLFKFIQDRNKIDNAFYIGKGKAEEIAELAEMNDISLIIFDDDLTPTQVRNLERVIDKKILDRSGLILDIFAAHARTKEAKTQVELAQLEYMLPRLTRAWTHLQKQYGGIGTKGPGETQIETDRRIIRSRINKLKERLDKIESQQRTKSSKRKSMFKVSLVGYTNAGKSTLLNHLTNAGVLAEDKLFATLDSTTRNFELEKNTNLVISDTVGFIRKLPHRLIASFKSTLNVVRDADLILHVIDITHDFYEDHINVVNEMLKELESDKKPIITIFNKVDALEDKSRLGLIKNSYPDSVFISAQRAININALKEKLRDYYYQNYQFKRLTIPNSKTKLIAMIHSLAEVISLEYEENDVIIEYKTNTEISSKIERLLNEQ